MTFALVLSIQGHSRFARPGSGFPARSTLRRWISVALTRDAELVLRLVGAREGRRLNQSFRRKDRATNVLTFGYQSSPTVRADILVCVPVVRSEARAQGKPFRDHLAHLVVHGVLHAQGFDHDRPRRARDMEKREVNLLASLGIVNPYV